MEKEKKNQLQMQRRFNLLPFGRLYFGEIGLPFVARKTHREGLRIILHGIMSIA